MPSDAFVKPAEDLMIMVDQSEIGGILVSGKAEKFGRCLSQGAVTAFRSLFFPAEDAEAPTIRSAAAFAFLALHEETGNQGYDRARFDADFLSFVEGVDDIGVTETRPVWETKTERTVTEREDHRFGTRAAPLDPGRLLTRRVGEYTVEFHQSDFRFPPGTMTPDKSLIVSGDATFEGRFGGARLAGCTTCGACGACAACTLCAEVNFSVAAGFLVAVDFAIHLIN